jgi:uncharacterized protein YbjT (DUF2867 family)
MAKTILIAGATGYLGRYLCAAFTSRGWKVHALVRNASRADDLVADTLIEAQATDAATLHGVMQGKDAVISALGITRQADGLSYRDVDYQANVNLLVAAEHAGVQQFAYVHVLNAARMRGVPLVTAKSDFVQQLQRTSIASTVISPSGYFSDMGDFLNMARQGRVWLFGDGQKLINPIHGADLAELCVEAVEQGKSSVDVGGPESFTHDELAALAFRALGRPVRITHLPDMIRRGILWLLPLAPQRISGPARFFLTAMGMNMVGEAFGTHRLADHFAELAQSTGNRTAGH